MDIIEQLRQPVDNRRDIIIGEDKFHTIQLAVHHFIQVAQNAISERNVFHVALSGGSTPKAIYTCLAEEPNKDQIDWSKVYLWWSDERAVEASHSDSNYRMALSEGFDRLSIPEEHQFRMKGEGDIEKHALEYENSIKQYIANLQFDLIMLGMGEDGHTASLFPQTHALHSDGRLVVANYVPKLNAWRMTFTYKLINQAREIAVYVLGEDKAMMLKTILHGEYSSDDLPLQKVGTPSNKALFIVDSSASQKL